jgi:hypothetical protein
MIDFLQCTFAIWIIAKTIVAKKITANATQKIAENITRPNAMRRPQLGQATARFETWCAQSGQRVSLGWLIFGVSFLCGSVGFLCVAQDDVFVVVADDLHDFRAVGRVDHPWVHG